MFKNPFEKFQTTISSIDYLTTNNDLINIKNSLLAKVNDRNNIITIDKSFLKYQRDGFFFNMIDLYLKQINDLQFKLNFKKPVKENIIYISADRNFNIQTFNTSRAYQYDRFMSTGLEYQMENKIGNYSYTRNYNGVNQSIIFSNSQNTFVYKIKKINNRYYFNRQFNINMNLNIDDVDKYVSSETVTFISAQTDITSELDTIKQLLLNKVFGGKFNISRYDFSLSIADDIIFTVNDNQLTDTNSNITSLINKINDITNSNNIFMINNLKGSMFKLENMLIKLKIINKNVIVYSLTFTEPLKLYNISRPNNTSSFILGTELRNNYTNVSFKFTQNNNNIFFNRIATVPDATAPTKNRYYNSKCIITNELNQIMNTLNITSINPSSKLTKIIRAMDKEIIFYISNY